MNLEPISLTDDQLEVVRRVAEERGVTVEAAASQLQSEALAALIHNGTGRVPAKVYASRGKPPAAGSSHVEVH